MTTEEMRQSLAAAKAKAAPERCTCGEANLIEVCEYLLDRVEAAEIELRRLDDLMFKIDPPRPYG